MYRQTMRSCRCSAVLLATLLAVGCSSSKTDVNQGTSGGNRASTSVKRLILLTNGDDPFWDAMRKGMNQAAEDFQLAEASMSVFLDKGDFSEEAQINKLKQYATQADIAAVAISPVDAGNRGIADAMKELRAKGVQVITVDSDMDRQRYRDTRFAYLGTDNMIGGRELGKTAKGLLPDGGKYATFVGLKAVANAQERIGGFAEGAGDKFQEADSLGDGGDDKVAQDNVRTVLNNHPDVRVLVGIWAYNAHAIVEVVKERNRRDQTTIVVFDAAPAALKDMEEGNIDAMIVQNPYQMGYLGTRLMRALVEEDHAVIKEMYPAYDQDSGGFAEPDGDILTTELRVVVPDQNSPLQPEMFDSGTKYFHFSDFKDWLAERQLTGS